MDEKKLNYNPYSNPAAPEAYNVFSGNVIYGQSIFPMENLVLPPPYTLKTLFPLTPALTAKIASSRKKVYDIICNNDPEEKRLLAIVGPCSIHNPDAALKYAEKLKKLAKEVEDSFIVVMRVYFEKPRTTTGWKGLIYDPDLDGSGNIAKGIRIARNLMMDIAEMGLPIATEMLDPVTAMYIDDLVSWASIGARTVESQTHRQFASGLSFPVGFKNSTDGSLQAAADAIIAARAEHTFVAIRQDGRAGVFHTPGNPAGHMVLRGSSHGINYDAAGIAEAVRKLSILSPMPRLIIDCSHGNSGKDYTKQKIAFHDIIEQYSTGKTAIAGFMLESYLAPGNQKLKAGTEPLADVSVTDECISFEETEELLRTGAEILRKSSSETKSSPAEGNIQESAPVLTAKNISYLGPEGTFSQMAAEKAFGKESIYFPCNTFKDIFDSIAVNKADAGCIPIENSISGVVAQNLDLLLKYPLYITGETAIAVHQCLLGHASIEDITTLYTHPQSRMQCSRWISEFLPGVRIMELESNAYAAKMASEDPHGAALGCELAAKLYDLNVLKKDITDVQGGMTRFLLLGKKPALPTSYDKTSLCFCIADRSGALSDCLDPFRKHHVTLTMIESRPSRHKRWEYLFYIDLLGNQKDPEVAAALRELEPFTSFIRIFGSYPALKEEQLFE